MASLKEVKGRIATVSNTQKITSAMKMVASAKLHKAQAAIQHMLSYKESLYRILHHLLSANPSITSSFTINREIKQMGRLVITIARGYGSGGRTMGRLLAEELGIKMGDFMMPVRMAVTGSRVSPPLMGSILILGVEKSIERVKRTLEKF